jgi:putative glutamine amidotransferase
MKTAPRIAVPMPHSVNREYSERAIPQYEKAIDMAGGQAVRIPLDRTEAEVIEIAKGCDAVLLPGSNADVDPRKFHAPRSYHTAIADPRRDAVDYLLLDDAYQQHKPVLGICYGLQNLNVYLKGSLVQHIPDFLPEATRSKVNHEAGKNVAVAHMVEIEPDSKLARIVAVDGRGPRFEVQRPIVVPVNSSHHQSVDAIGEGLCMVARCPDDGIIEALEGTALDHFVIAVQWHPERSVDQDEPSRAIFHALVDAAAQRHRS